MNQEAGNTHVIVIGSGFGGAVAACRLAQAGFKVTILERGRRYRQGDFPNLPQDSSFLPDERRWNWSLDQGLWDVQDLEEVVSVQAAGFGGGSLVYANVHLRPPASVFDDSWPTAHRGRTKLDPYFNLVASMLEVQPVNAHPNFHRKIVKSEQLASAASNLGRRAFYPPLAIRYQNGPNAHGVPQQGCTGCGACCAGCPQSAKNTLDLNYLAIAEGRGAEVFTQCEVTGLVENPSGEWLIQCFDHLEARKRNFRAHHVFLCAGSVHSTRLMMTARLLRRHGVDPAVPRQLSVRKLVGVGYFPGGDAIGIVYQTQHPQQPSVGPAISTAVVEWSATNPSSFFMLQDGGYPPRVDRMVGILRASSLLDRNKLTDSGPARVPRYNPPAGPPEVGEPAVPFASSRAPSCPDDLLSAYRAGSFAKMVPKQLKSLKPLLSVRVSTPLVLQAVVGQTIRRGFLSRRSWLGRLGRFSELAVGFAKGVAKFALGDEDSLGVHAFHALLDGGHLASEELAAKIAGYDASAREHRAVLLAMGRDAAIGALQYDRKRQRMVADLNLVELTPGYSRQESLMTDVARELGGELRTNPAWDFLRKPITVHSQGGCRMSDDPSSGVTDAFGKVHQCPGLYILDGSILCSSVGVNPSATIAALAERAVLEFIRTHKPNWPDNSSGGLEYLEQTQRAAEWATRAAKQGWELEPPAPGRLTLATAATPNTPPIGLEFSERLNGYYHPASSKPRDDAGFLAMEGRGRPHYPIELQLTLRADNLAAFFDDPRHILRVAGSIGIRLPGRPDFASFPVCGGEVNLLVPVAKDYAIPETDTYRLKAQERASPGRYASVRGRKPEERLMSYTRASLGRYASVRGRKPEERLMNYTLPFHDEQGRSWVLRGYKRIASTSSLNAWRQTSIVFLTLSGLTLSGENQDEHAFFTEGAGAVHADLTAFLFEQLPSVVATGTNDPVRQAWAVSEFSEFFFGTLQRIYLPALRDIARQSSARRRLQRCEH